MDRPGVVQSGILKVESTSKELIESDGTFREIHNMRPTAGGGYASISLPIPFIWNYDGTTAEIPEDVGSASPTGGAVVYGETRGLHHAVLANGRELLLLHVDDQIWEWTGWTRGWRVLVGSSTYSPIFEQSLVDPLNSDYPTQFVTTPNAVIIIPSGGGRAVIYDGIKAKRLGYSQRPAPPVAMGPRSSGVTYMEQAASSIRKIGVNDTGYAMDGLHSNEDTGMPYIFKHGRLGTVQSMPIVTNGDPTDVTSVSGYLLPGRYRYWQQWVDCFGDLSPISYASNDVHFDKQPSVQWKVDSSHALSTYDTEWAYLDAVRKQVGVVFDNGPDGTIAKIGYRTKDITGKGDTRPYVLPRDASVNSQAYATVPDNISKFYPDNIPDEWLAVTPEEVEPVPFFKVAELFNSRLFAANSIRDPGAVWITDVGKYGTFLSRLKFYPDPNGAEVTGLKRVSGGLLAFSRNSTYLITPNDAGDNYRSATLDSSVGCVAPSSIATLRDSGLTVWLGRDGFYGYDGESVKFLFGKFREDVVTFNAAMLHRSVAYFDPASGEYRCWVPSESSTVPNVCWIYDGVNWRTRDDIYATGVVTTADHRNMSIACGSVDVSGTRRHGVWVLDQAGEQAEGYLRSGWIRSTRSSTRSSSRRLRLLLRETESATDDADKLIVRFYKDYRFGTNDVVDTQYKNMYPSEGVPVRNKVKTEPELWGGTTWANATFRTRRPFWISVDFNVSDIEVWAFDVQSTSRFEVIAFAFHEEGRDSGDGTGYR